MWRRLLVALLFCGACFFSGQVASYATVGDPAPMPTEGGVPDVWRCEDVPMPEPTATVTPDPVVEYDDSDPPEPTATVTPPPYPVPSPTATDSRCRVTSWATSPPIPTPVVTPSPGVSAVPSEVVVTGLGESALSSIYDTAWPFLFLLGALVMSGVCWLVFHLSRPPMFGSGS